MLRGPSADHLLVRMADEGIPVAAMARALKRPSGEIWPVLRDAKESGIIVALPAADWPANTRRDDRAPTIAPIRLSEMDDLAMPLMIAFRLTATESLILSVLMARREISKPALHLAMSKPENDKNPKIVDVMLCKLRRKLDPYQIRINTVWGRGYSLPLESFNAIVGRLAEDRRGAAR